MMLGDPGRIAGRAGVELAGRGCSVAFCWPGSGSEARAVCLEAVASGGSAMALDVDLSDFESIADAAGAVVDHWGRADAAVFAGLFEGETDGVLAEAAAAACGEIRKRRGWGKRRTLVLVGDEQEPLWEAAERALAAQKRGKPFVHVVAPGEAESELLAGTRFVSVESDAEMVDVIVASVYPGEQNTQN